MDRLYNPMHNICSTFCHWVAQISEERFGMMETSLSKFGMMLDSIQSDFIQANRGTKQVFLESEFFVWSLFSIYQPCSPALHNE